MAQAPESVEQSAKDLADWIRGQEVGSLKVVDSDVRFDENADGRLAIFLEITLSDPLEGEETWPLDDVLELHRKIDERANAIGVAFPWHVTLQKETPEEFEPEELDSEQH